MSAPATPARIHVIPTALMARTLRQCRVALDHPGACAAALTADGFIAEDVEAGLHAAIAQARLAQIQRRARRVAPVKIAADLAAGVLVVASVGLLADPARAAEAAPAAGALDARLWLALLMLMLIAVAAIGGLRRPPGGAAARPAPPANDPGEPEEQPRRVVAFDGRGRPTLPCRRAGR